MFLNLYSIPRAREGLQDFHEPVSIHFPTITHKRFVCLFSIYMIQNDS